MPPKKYFKKCCYWRLQAPIKAGMKNTRRKITNTVRVLQNFGYQFDNNLQQIVKYVNYNFNLITLHFLQFTLIIHNAYIFNAAHPYTTVIKAKS